MKIKPLPEEVAARIAAGEVVERPASVVKELIENSIDAGATSVEVTTESGGKGLIRVADDGEGMSREEALLAIQRHTTSKLSSIEDLERITTLGFRGEALYAISAVSRFSLTTRREDEPTGVKVWVENGEVLEVTETPRQRGTTVEVRDLFFNLPARRRFLRSNPTELGHVTKVVEWYLLSNPTIGFSLVNDDREVFTYPPDSWENRVSSHWEIPTGNLVSLGFKAPGIRVEGFTTLPPLSFRNRTRMVFSVNGHPVQDPILSAAAREAFEGLLPKGEYPGLLLVITLPPREVDVNVHPTKREVRFKNGNMVFSAVKNALKGALGGDSPRVWTFQERSAQTGLPLGAADDKAVYGNRESKPAYTPPPGGRKSYFTPTRTPRSQGAGTLFEPVREGKGWEYLGEVEGVYLVFETQNGELVVVDKHACHERMLFEEIIKGEKRTSPLLTPMEVPLSPEEVEAAEAHRELVEDLGFSFEIGNGRVVLKAVPTWARGRSEEAFRKALQLEGGRERRELLARWACRAAVKGGEATSLMDVEALASWLTSGREDLTCPHGRPIVVRLTKELLDRLFKRRM